MSPDDFQTLLGEVRALRSEVEAMRAHIAAIEERLLMRPIPPQQLEREAPWRRETAADEGLAPDTARAGEVDALHEVVGPPGAAP